MHLLVLTPVCSNSVLGPECCGALLSHPALSFFRRRCSSRPSEGKHAIALKALLAGRRPTSARQLSNQLPWRRCLPALNAHLGRTLFWCRQRPLARFMATHVQALTESSPSICREGWPQSRFDASKVDMLTLNVGRSEEDSYWGRLWPWVK